MYFRKGPTLHRFKYKNAEQHRRVERFYSPLIELPASIGHGFCDYEVGRNPPCSNLMAREKETSQARAKT